MWKSKFKQNYYRTSFSPTVPPFAARISHVVVDGGTWWLKWERLKAGESNGKLPPRTFQGCSVPEPYWSHDWALIPAKPSLQGWILMNESCDVHLLNELLETDVPWDDAIVESAGKLRELWDSLGELRSSVCERRLERTVLRPALLSVKTAQFTQFFHQVSCHTVKSLSLTDSV